MVVVNLKPAKFAGILSQGMLLAASNSDKTQVEILQVPQDANIGEPITFEGYYSEPLAVLNPKHKIFEKCAPGFSTTEDCIATFQNVPFFTSDGPVFVKSLQQATIG